MQEPKSLGALLECSQWCVILDVTVFYLYKRTSSPTQKQYIVERVWQSYPNLKGIGQRILPLHSKGPIVSYFLCATPECQLVSWLSLPVVLKHAKTSLTMCSWQCQGSKHWSSLRSALKNQAKPLQPLYFYLWTHSCWVASEVPRLV